MKYQEGAIGSGVESGLAGSKFGLFHEQVPEGRDEEGDDRKQRQEKTDPDHVLDGVIGMEGNAVERFAVRPAPVLDLDAVGIVGTHLAQRHQVQCDQQQQHQRDRHHVQREEAVDGGIGHAVVAADPFHQRPARRPGWC